MQHIHFIRKHLSTLTGLLLAVVGTTAIPLPAQTTNSESAGSVSNAPPAVPVVQIKADKVKAKMPPTFYGLMTEEINFSYEGGLYGELIRNGTFKADAIQQNLKPDVYDPAKYYPATYPANRAPRYLEQRRRRGPGARRQYAIERRAERKPQGGRGGGVKNFPGGRRQRRLLGHSGAAQDNLQSFLLRKSGARIHRPADGQHRRHEWNRFLPARKFPASPANGRSLKRRSRRRV